MQPKTILLSERNCPWCHNPCKAVTDVDGERTPAPGDISVCAICYNVIIFDDDMNYIKASYEDLQNIEEQCPGILEEINKRKLQINTMFNQHGQN
jgi:hypothetical protein